jgi:hypothetical protein
LATGAAGTGRTMPSAANLFSISLIARFPLASAEAEPLSRSRDRLNR